MALANWIAEMPAEEGFFNQNVFLLAGRLLLGGPFLISGTQKLMTVSNFAEGLARRGIPEPLATPLSYLGATVEALGGFLVVFGGATTWIALLMILFTITATLISHRFWEYEGTVRQAQYTNFTKNLMIIGGFCILHVAGSGRYSIDGWRRSRL
jgi:putative oxidoreductase